jgi:hypothetical protein
MIERLAGRSSHALGHDQPVAMTGITLEAEQANPPLLGERHRFGEIELGLRFFHMGKEHALEGVEVAGMGRVAAAL